LRQAVFAVKLEVAGGKIHSKFGERGAVGIHWQLPLRAFYCRVLLRDPVVYYVASASGAPDDGIMLAITSWNPKIAQATRPCILSI
jgi:hypothetical protein